METTKPEGKAPGECACIGLKQDTSESDTISESREGHFRKDRLNMTLPEKEPCLTPFLSSSSTSGLPQANTSLQRSIMKVENMPLNA